MPWKPASPCSHPGCPSKAVSQGRCHAHQRQQQRAYDRERGTAAQRGYGSQWRATRAAFLRRHPTCEGCGQPATEAHHVVRKRDGGDDSDGNLVAYCRACHSRVTAREDAFGRASR